MALAVSLENVNATRASRLGSISGSAIPRCCCAQIWCSTNAGSTAYGSVSCQRVARLDRILHAARAWVVWTFGMRPCVAKIEAQQRRIYAKSFKDWLTRLTANGKRVPSFTLSPAPYIACSMSKIEGAILFGTCFPCTALKQFLISCVLTSRWASPVAYVQASCGSRHRGVRTATTKAAAQQIKLKFGDTERCITPEEAETPQHKHFGAEGFPKWSLQEMALGELYTAAGGVGHHRFEATAKR